MFSSLTTQIVHICPKEKTSLLQGDLQKHFPQTGLQISAKDFFFHPLDIQGSMAVL